MVKIIGKTFVKGEAFMMRDPGLEMCLSSFSEVASYLALSLPKANARD